MAYDPFFGGGNGTNQILPKRPSKQPQGPGPLRVPDVQMGQPQVAPYAAPYAQPGPSPIQYPAPQTYNRPLTITAAMMQQQSPWTQGSRQPFPAPNAPNRLGAPWWQGGAEIRKACEKSEECGPGEQCMRGLCEPTPIVMGSNFSLYRTKPRRRKEACFSYEMFVEINGVEQCIMPPSLAAQVLPKNPDCAGGIGCALPYLYCDPGGPETGGAVCRISPQLSAAYEAEAKAQGVSVGPAPAGSEPTKANGQSRRGAAPPKDYVPGKESPAAPVVGPFAPAPTSSGAAAVNPATGMTEAEMEEATALMEDKLICRILTARKTKSGLDGQSREYIEVIAPYADAVARKREICDYAPKVADVIQLPVGEKRNGGRQPGSICPDGTIADAQGVCASDVAAGTGTAVSRGRATTPPRAAAPAEPVTQGAERPQSVAPPMQPAAATPDYAAEEAAKEAAAKEAALLEEAIKRVDEMSDKLICKVIGAAAAYQGLEGMSETFVKMLAPYADAVAQKRGICGYKLDEPAPAPEAAKPEPTPVEPGDTLPPATNGGTPSKPPPEPYKPPPDLMPTPPSNGGGGGGGGGYVGPGTYDYGGGGGGGGGGGMMPPPDVRTSRQLVVKQGIPWWVWVLIVGGVGTLAYYARKKKAGLAGHDDEDGKPLMIELSNPEEV